MANSADNTAIVPDGLIYLAAPGATLPTSSAWTPTSEYTEIGYYSEDGYSLTPNPGSTTELIAHNGDVVHETADSNGNWALAFGPIETKQAVVEAYFDATVDLATGAVTVTRATTQREHVVVAVALPKDGRRIVKAFPKVKVSDREGITFNRTTLITYGMTFKTYASDEVLDADNNPSHFRIFDPLYLNS